MGSGLFVSCVSHTQPYQMTMEIELREEISEELVMKRITETRYDEGHSKLSVAVLPLFTVCSVVKSLEHSMFESVNMAMDLAVFVVMVMYFNPLHSSVARATKCWMPLKRKLAR